MNLHDVSHLSRHSTFTTCTSLRHSFNTFLLTRSLRLYWSDIDLFSMSSTPLQRRRASPPPAGPLSGPSGVPLDARSDARDRDAWDKDIKGKESDADARLRNKLDGPVNASTLPFGGRKLSRAGTVGGLRRREWILLSTVCVIACFVRLWNLSWPTSVV